MKTYSDRGVNMKLKITQVVLTGAALVAFTVASPCAMAQDDKTKGQQTAGGQMKEGGKEMGKAGKSLGSNVKHGRVARGGKHFGKHVYHGGKHIGKGTAKAAKKTGSAVKKAVTP
jgi:hypothetical protein